MDWLSAITQFQNLEKLEIDIFIPGGTPYLDLSVFEVFDIMRDNPMPKLKELKLSHVNVFCQDVFLGWYLFKVFPNLETFTVKGEIKGPLTHWRLSFMVKALKNLALIKNLTLPNMDMYTDAHVSEIGIE